MQRLAAMLIALLLVAGCDSSSEQPAAGSDAPAKHPQRLTDGTISDPKSFNAIIAVDATSASAVGELFDALVRVNPRTTEIGPALAERWEYNTDGTVSTFYLRHDVHWHDGVPFTAQDVI